MKKSVILTSLLGIFCSCTNKTETRNDGYAYDLAKEVYEKQNHLNTKQKELSAQEVENLRTILANLHRKSSLTIYFVDGYNYNLEKCGSNVSLDFDRNCAYPIHWSIRDATFKWLKSNGFIVEETTWAYLDGFYKITLPKYKG